MTMIYIDEIRTCENCKFFMFCEGVIEYVCDQWEGVLD